MKTERVNRIVKQMEEQGVQRIIIAAPASIFYLTGKWFSPGERLSALLIDIDGNHKLFNNRLFPVEEDLGVEIQWYSDTDDAVAYIAEKIGENDTIGVDKIWPAKFLLRLMELRPACRFVNGSCIVDEIRAIKDEEEQDKMREASRLNDLAIERLIPYVSKGMTEMGLVNKLMEIYEDLGVEGLSFPPICAYGANGADPHHHSDKISKGKSGDCVVIDIGGVKDGYCSDMTRTVFIGKASDKASKVYEIVREANARGIAAAKPGNRMCDVDWAARSYIEEQGYGAYFTHRTGHCIGIEGHETGDVSAVNEAVIKPGMIFSVEPGIYLPGEVGVRIEDLVLITEDGCEVLNQVDKNLRIVEE